MHDGHQLVARRRIYGEAIGRLLEDVEKVGIPGSVHGAWPNNGDRQRVGESACRLLRLELASAVGFDGTRRIVLAQRPVRGFRRAGRGLRRHQNDATDRRRAHREGGKNVRDRDHVAVAEFSQRPSFRHSSHEEDVRRAGPYGTLAHGAVVEQVRSPVRDACIARNLTAFGPHQGAHRCTAFEQRVHEVRADES